MTFYPTPELEIYEAEIFEGIDTLPTGVFPQSVSNELTIHDQGELSGFWGVAEFVRSF
jgi:hypothetical protein